MATATLLTNMFATFPREMEIAARLVLTYGELEFSMALCIGAAIGDNDQAIRVVYRTYGEERRIAVAGALGLPSMTKLGLNHRFQAALADMQWCRQIRNQYAHGHFVPSKDNKAPVRFMDLQEAAESNAPIILTMRPIARETLDSQDKFFTYVGDCLDLLKNGAEGKVAIPKLQWPIQTLKPPRYTGDPKSAPQTQTGAPEPSPSDTPPAVGESQSE
jgi:hypothetical protein